MPEDRFAFHFDPRYRPLLAVLGVRPGNAELRLGPDLHVRFGRWSLRTPLDNVTATSVAGPHNPLKAIGVRLSFADRGVTFGSNADRTVCIQFRDPVPAIEPLGLIAHPNCSVSVAEPERVVERLSTVAGL